MSKQKTLSGNKDARTITMTVTGVYDATVAGAVSLVAGTLQIHRVVQNTDGTVLIDGPATPANQTAIETQLALAADDIIMNTDGYTDV